ncbi:translation initiation factor IF-1A [Sulfodiicoccus acidiphilus]|uniref:Translation initiation factor 1A n=1 Tax=Sulfodiicoccus acidiphilus TaxID=1670455 RepID=A0A348B3R0_9CREN|nr:translation initiation factor aIF-1A [Sulfodiicoccus acidiphilus]BBD72812.1 translation initiation factor IF-1A [Sulfodiicoccus acidiphilus]GGU04301.1 translation initiation factor IF-1A [Sulfodiicoccus acidiphilus]
MPKKTQDNTTPREIPRPAEGEVICVVKKTLGGDHLSVRCFDGVERLARIPGRMKKKVWMREGDVILAAPWDIQSNKCDVVYKYGNDEVRKLIEFGVIDPNILDQLRG